MYSCDGTWIGKFPECRKLSRKFGFFLRGRETRDAVVCIYEYIVDIPNPSYPQVQVEADHSGVPAFHNDEALQVAIVYTIQVLRSVILVESPCRYESPQHMMEEFFNLRMEYYHRRKNSLLDKLQKEWSKLDNKVSYWICLDLRRVLHGIVTYCDSSPIVIFVRRAV